MRNIGIVCNGSGAGNIIYLIYLILCIALQTGLCNFGNCGKVTVNNTAV